MNTSSPKCLDLVLPVKTCKKCLSSFVGRECAPCVNARRRELRALNGDESRAKDKAWRDANKEEIKAKRDIYIAANLEKIRKQGAQARIKNREKINAVNRERYEKDKVTIRADRSAQQALDPLRYSEQAKTWRRNNPEKVAEINRANRARYQADVILYRRLGTERKSKNRESARESSKKWAKSHPEARRISKRNRDAKKKSSNGILSQGLAAKLFSLQKGMCPCCRQPLGESYQLDHKMPLALGGSNTDDNIQLLRAICNQQKNAKHPVDFMQSRGFLL